MRSRHLPWDLKFRHRADARTLRAMKASPAFVAVALLAACTSAKGPAGPQGPRGEAGAAGATGAQGQTGAVGTAGAQGVPGPTGDQGSAGVKGDPGTQGAQGVPGPQGNAGSKGDPGAQGPMGIDGSQGPAGDAGASATRLVLVQGDGGVVGPVEGDGVFVAALGCILAANPWGGSLVPRINNLTVYFPTYDCSGTDGWDTSLAIVSFGWPFWCESGAGQLWRVHQPIGQVLATFHSVWVSGSNACSTSTGTAGNALPIESLPWAPTVGLGTISYSMQPFP